MGRIYFLFLVTIFITTGCSGSSLSNDNAKYSYAVGKQVGMTLKRQDVEIDMDAFVLGIKDTIAGKESRITEEQINEAVKNVSELAMKKHKEKAEKNAKAGDEFLKKNLEKPGIKTTKSGLQYKVIKEGNGPKALATDTVSVHYKGTLIDGKEFDSSYKRNEPAVFELGRVIPGWVEGIQLMSKGSKYELVIPSDLAYGERANAEIPANSVLIFEVELLDIIKK
jgi:FKBP-type peptidyl-prolyl cis-trans isomerase